MNRLTRTTWLLIAANLLPIFGVLIFHWSVYSVLLLFWVENVIVGVITLVRISLAGGAKFPPNKLFLMPFFCVHYGGFAAGHLVFLSTLFGPDPDRFLDLRATFDDISSEGIWLAALGLAVSHVVSLLTHYVGGREMFSTTADAEMTRPYKRVMVMHIALLLGGFAAMSLNSHWIALLVLIGLKIQLDVRAHQKAHQIKGKAKTVDQ